MIAMFGLVAVASLPAAGWFSHDVDVIAVTDMTDKGRTYPVPSPGHPVYYMLYDMGPRAMGTDFNATQNWAGESMPNRTKAIQWVMVALAQQGYQIADNNHPPTQFFVYTWGMIAGKDTMSTDSFATENPIRPALRFLGGDKVNLMWELETHGGYVDSRSMLRGFQRTGITGKIWDYSGGNLFIARVRSLTIESRNSLKKTLLWETRFACPSDGLALDESLPLMIKAAAPYFGRETVKPVNVNATKVYGGHVDLGDFKVLEYLPDGSPKDHAPAQPANPEKGPGQPE
jgi:hypothetical protein